MRYRLRTLLITVALFGVFLAYARLYLVRTISWDNRGKWAIRVYRTPLEVRLFKPAASVESFVTGRKILIAHHAPGWEP